MKARLILFTATLVAFGASLWSGFHYDDYSIFADPAMASASGWMEMFTVRQTRPLTYLTLWINYAIEGSGSAIGYHVVNLALHLAAVALALECLRKLLPERAAVAAAAIFALHPIQAEAVDYIWARSIVLATVLCLAALLEWLNGRHWTAVVWFGAALLAKEEVAAFPLVLLLIDRKRWAPIGAMLSLSLAAGVRTAYATAVVAAAGAGGAGGALRAPGFSAPGAGH